MTARRILTALTIPLIVVALTAASRDAKKPCDPQDKKIWKQCTKNILNCPCEMTR